MQITHASFPAVTPIGNPSTVDLLVRFRPDAPAEPSLLRRPLNLSVVIDRSGSMAGNPLRYALQAAQDLVDRLEPGDILSVVTYDDHIDTVIPPQPVTDKNAIKTALQRVRAGGTTNLSGGWLKGCEHVLANHSSDRVNRVLLLTDGQANVGVTRPDLLIQTARDKAEAGVVTTTLGFGSSFNEDLLIGMAQASDGNFYFIQTPNEATEVFGIELDTMKSVIGQNLTATIITEPGVAIASVLNSYRTETADGKIIITLGDLYAGEDKLLALELNLPAYAASGEQPLFALTYGYDKIGAKSIERSEGSVSATVRSGTMEEASAAAPATDLLVEISRIRVARAKDAAVELADKGDFAGGAKLLRDLIASLKAKGLDERFEIAEEIEQLEHFARRIERKQVGADIRKEMRDQSYQARSRSRNDLSQRGLSVASDELFSLPVVADAENGVELECVRDGGKLRMKVVSDGFNPMLNVQFPRAIRAEGVHYLADGLELSANGEFYRAVGDIKRLKRPGDPDPLAGGHRPTAARTGKASSAPPTAADLETTDTVGDGVLVQAVKEGSKLRARVVSDGFDPDRNMRFPRSIREEGMLYVVDEVTTTSDGVNYVACGKIRRFLQANP